LGFGAGLCVSVWQHASSYVSVAWLAAFMVGDHADGVIARWLRVDTNRRRIADVVVDRLTIHPLIVILMWVTPETIWLLLPVFIRDVVLILRNWWLLTYKRVMITADNIHRAGVFLYAVLFVTLLFTTGETAVWVSVAISVFVWILLFDYLRAGALVPIEPKGQPLASYQACGLRALRGIAPSRKNIGV